MFAILAMAAYLAWWPVPIAAVGWDAPVPLAVAVNSKLAQQRQWPLAGETGPEHVLAAADGALYTGVASGKVLRIGADGAVHTYADTGGRPLGLAFDGHGALIVADAMRGLLSVDRTGTVAVLSASVAGQPIGFANAVAVARSGKMYFSDASQRFTPARWGGTVQAATLDVLEQSCTGRVLEYDPAARATRIVASGLCFANGVALSADERALFVAESARYRVWKIAVDADAIDVTKDGPAAVVLLDNLPGYPDNVTRGLDGKLWLGLAGPRNELDALARRPFLREMALRLPRALLKTPLSHGHVIAFAEDGTLREDLQDAGGAPLSTTGATETATGLYLHNVDGNSLGWIAR